MEKATVQSIDRALSIVEALAGEKEGLGVTEISTRVGLHKSTVHRLLSALGERGYVEQRSGGAYRLGMKIVELSSLYLNQVELKTEAQPYLRRLLQLTKQPVHLAMLEGLDRPPVARTLHGVGQGAALRSAGCGALRKDPRHQAADLYLPFHHRSRSAHQGDPPDPPARLVAGRSGA